MTYSQFLDTLYQFIPYNKSCKDNSCLLTAALDEKLGSPSKCYPIIHVAGTNGKGSVVCKIAQTYASEGYRVGVFTSPHLECIRERIKINQEVISEEEFLVCGEKVLSILKAFKPKVYFFEILTLMALDYFAQKKVDFVILETGIGGRFDSTNFITPILSIITSISYDHCHLLGNSLEEIAFQKAGIIKEGVPVVLGPSAQIPIITKEVAEKKSLLICTEYAGTFFDEENSAIAKDALNYLAKYFSIKDESVSIGLKCRPSCRFKVYTPSDLNIEHVPDYLILDVAHNPDGFKKLIEAIDIKLNRKSLCFLIGMSKGKEIKECLKTIAAHASSIYLAPVDHFKLLKPQELQNELTSIGFTKCSYEEDLDQTLKKALTESAAQNEVLVICGSFYIMAEIKKSLGLHSEL